MVFKVKGIFFWENDNIFFLEFFYRVMRGRRGRVEYFYFVDR